MKALIWCAPYKVAVENVPDPTILNRRDAIIRITSTCICGSDLHLVDGFIPFMKPGDIIGHEPMGIVKEVGPDVDQSKLKVGDRVVVPFPIGCKLECDPVSLPRNVPFFPQFEIRNVPSFPPARLAVR